MGPEGPSGCIIFQRWDYNLQKGPERIERYNKDLHFYTKDTETNLKKAIGSFSTVPMKSAQRTCQHRLYQRQTNWSNIIVKSWDGDG
jgi:hypothetical protein